LAYHVNPQITQAIQQFAGTSAATPKAHTDPYWSSVYEKMATPGAALSTGMYAGDIMRAGEGGRAVSEGDTVDAHTANAGGGEQWGLVNAEKNAGRVKVAGTEGEQVGKTTDTAMAQGGRYELGRARSTNQFNLGKVGEESKALAGGSQYTPSPWLGIVQGLISGAAGGIHGPGDSTGPGLGGDPNLESGGPGDYAPGGTPWEVPDPGATWNG
jgi:hypothetical protein